jgi:P27 family predicted phage terminase small subunit
MGARGVRPKPTNLRILHGDRKDRINTDEPPAPDGVAQCPVGVSAEVREVWDYTVKQLTAMRCVSPADRDALICFCEAVVVHRQASRSVASLGVMVSRTVDDVVRVERNPALQAQRDAATLIARFAGHFGLSPSARSEIRNPRSADHGASADRFLTG